MGILINLKSKAELSAELEVKRAAMKAVPEKSRADSQEFTDFVIAEQLFNKGMHGPFGLSLPECYVNAVFMCESNEASVTASFFATEESRLEKEGAFKQIQFRLDVPDKMPSNPLTFSYDYLKTLPLFADATDAQPH